MPTPFELMYRKQKHPRLFESLEAAQTGICNLQNYIPIYHRFFSLSDTNHNHINLNHRHHVASVAAGANKHVVSVTLESTDSESPLVKTDAFIKYSPLLDPIKHLSGKYDMAVNDLLTLPKYEGVADSVHQKKMHDPNNSSYVDSFFTYLTSQALHTHGFVHGIDFYGSFLANQDEFTVNVYDELEYFNTCDFFLKHKNKLFRLDDGRGDDDVATGKFNSTQTSKPIMTIGEDMGDELSLSLEDNAACAFDDVFVAAASAASGSDNAATGLLNLEECVIADPDDDHLRIFSGSNSDDSDSCSSRSSASSDECHDNENDDNDDGNQSDGSNSSKHSGSNSSKHSGSNSDGSNSDGSNSSDGDDEVHNAHIFNFPVNAIIMEKCDNTLDSLMYGRNELSEPEWAAALMQIIMTLIAYQHMFAFTHNDLHTNNVMFVKTEKKFLHYLYNGVYYRVPTHGRIIKIIDFGRAIYKYRGQTMVSDSFDRTGDAATQYNCEPYMNPKKPRLDPNPSFDLCRLACSLFDYFVEDIRNEAEYDATLKESRVASMVVEWLKDDKERNVLYKKNGDERYPDFKLYKMIARTVHGAVPHDQLSKPMFAHFAIPRKQINGKPHIMDIDALPCYKDA
jgi:hypothetical protein